MAVYTEITPNDITITKEIITSSPWYDERNISNIFGGSSGGGTVGFIRNSQVTLSDPSLVGSAHHSTYNEFQEVVDESLPAPFKYSSTFSTLYGHRHLV